MDIMPLNPIYEGACPAPITINDNQIWVKQGSNRGTTITIRNWGDGPGRIQVRLSTIPEVRGRVVYFEDNNQKEIILDMQEGATKRLKIIAISPFFISRRQSYILIIDALGDGMKNKTHSRAFPDRIRCKATKSIKVRNIQSTPVRRPRRRTRTPFRTPIRPGRKRFHR